MPDGIEQTLVKLDTKALLVKLLQEIHKLNNKFDSMVKFGGKIAKAQEELLERTIKHHDTNKGFKLEPDMMTLFSLPSSLRKTVMALYKLREATAEDLARETKRLRAVESSAANTLVRMGFLAKRREGRNAYFFIE